MIAGSAPSLLQKNLEALTQGGQTLAQDWLKLAPSPTGITEVKSESGHLILVVDGQSQASRRDPLKEARQWLDKTLGQSTTASKDMENAGQPPVKILFGLGNPWLASLLLEAGPLLVYEPDPRIWLMVLAKHDFSSHLAGPQADRLTPESPSRLTIIPTLGLAQCLEGLKGWEPILVHPPAQRRAASQLANLKHLVFSKGKSYNFNRGAQLKIMVIPPLSGGSWSVATSLAKAVENEGHQLYFINWPQNLLALEKAAHAAAHAATHAATHATTQLFKETTEITLQGAQAFNPDIIIALAQAPLDISSLEKLRQINPAPISFWAVEDLNLFPYIAEVAPAYDFFFHIQKDFSENLARNWGISNAHYLPLAADAHLFRPEPKACQGVYGSTLSFMGAGYPNRRVIMHSLVKNYWPKTGLPTSNFKIFGSGWQGSEADFGEHLFEGGRRLTSEECALIYAGTTINLNIHSSWSTQASFNPDSLFVNPRTFEIAAAGGFQIVDTRPLLPELFTDKKELIVARDPGQLPDLIDYYLKNPTQMQAIGQAARKRVLQEHTYNHRLRQILFHLGA